MVTVCFQTSTGAAGTHVHLGQRACTISGVQLTSAALGPLDLEAVIRRRNQILYLAIVDRFGSCLPARDTRQILMRLVTHHHKWLIYLVGGTGIEPVAPAV